MIPITARTGWRDVDVGNDQRRIVSFCFPHVVDVSILSICIVLRAFVVVISMCLLYVCLATSRSPNVLLLPG